jgi:hypothetical protein
MSHKRPLCVSLAVALAACVTPAAAASHASGSLIIDGKPVEITQAYAYAHKGFFDPKKQDVVVLLCDAVVPAAAVRDDFARAGLVRAGKLHCVEQTIDADKQVINYRVETNRFHRPEGGASTEHVFEAKTFDGTTVAGRSRTKSPQKDFDDVPYSYDVTFSAPIEPMK